MPSQSLHFLDHLGLNDQADSRSIRRAYAQRLKCIDPSSDPTAFQELRGAYEAALAWCEERLNQESDTTAGEKPTRPVAPAKIEAVEAAAGGGPITLPVGLSDPIEDGTAVFTEFTSHVAAGIADEPAAERALKLALADERLVNLDALAYFEWRVAGLLMNGWEPGHEYLFTPATKTFDWERDSRRLGGFGRLGVVLDAAITEKLMFYRQPATSFERQRALIRRLRQPEPPSIDWLCSNLQLLETLAQRHGHWLHAISPVHRLHEWRTVLDRSLQRTVSTRKRHQPVPKASGPGRWTYSFFAVFAVLLTFAAIQDRKRPESHRASQSWDTPSAQVPSKAMPRIWEPGRPPVLGREDGGATTAPVILDKLEGKPARGARPPQPPTHEVRSQTAEMSSTKSAVLLGEIRIDADVLPHEGPTRISTHPHNKLPIGRTDSERSTPPPPNQLGEVTTKPDANPKAPWRLFEPDQKPASPASSP